MKILIVGDSLAFPRRTQQIVDAWPCVLQSLLKTKAKIDSVIWFRARGGANICSVFQEVQELSGYVNEKEFDFAIVQVGIVDCTPRPYSKFFSYILNASNIGQRLKLFIHNHIKFFYLFYSKPVVSEKLWQKKIEDTAVILKTLSKKTIFLCIAPPGEIFCKKVFKIEAAIEKYNKVLFSTVIKVDDENNLAIIDPYNQNYFDIKTDLMQNDGHHLTITGHHKVSRKVYEFISNKNILNASKELECDIVSS